MRCCPNFEQWQKGDQKYKKDLKVEVDRQTELTIKIHDNTEILKAQMKDITEYVKDELPKLREEFIGELKEQDERFEEQFNNFIKKAVDTLQTRLQSDSKEMLNKSEDELKIYFGDVWNKMLEATKTSLKSARMLWASCHNLTLEDNFDYSGVVICATAALEYELRKWFFDGFKNYLKDQGIDIKKWPEILTYSNDHGKNKKPSTIFTMGTMPFLFGQISKRDSNEIQNDVLHLEECREAYLATIMNSKRDQEKYSDCFTKNIFFINSNDLVPVRQSDNISVTAYEAGSLIAQFEYIREDFRNKSAHANQVSKKAAEECCARIMGKFEADSKVNNVFSVLLQLFELLK